MAGDFEDIQYLNNEIKHLEIEEDKDEDVADGQSSNLGPAKPTSSKSPMV